MAESKADADSEAASEVLVGFLEALILAGRAREVVDEVKRLDQQGLKAGGRGGAGRCNRVPWPCPRSLPC